MTKTSVNLTEKQRGEIEFLNSLLNIMKSSDLSKLDLKTTQEPGSMHKEHSVLVENYEINILRTPVYVYPDGGKGIFSMGEWKFEPGKYERYRLDVTENHTNKRVDDCPGNTLLPGQILLVATMATSLGRYKVSKLFLNRNTDIYEDLCCKQNAHLFAYARELYNVLDGENIRRRKDIVFYNVPESYTATSRANARNQLLKKLELKLQEKSK